MDQPSPARSERQKLLPEEAKSGPDFLLKEEPQVNENSQISPYRTALGSDGIGGDSN